MPSASGRHVSESDSGFPAQLKPSLYNSGKLPPAPRQTISFDHGGEFAEDHRLHNTLGMQTFFGDPRSPWQKGGVEKSIGRLRRWLPRNTNLDELTAADLRRHVERLNNTSRKYFKTPAEAFSELTAALQP
ncbi:hypothetical protein [Rhodopseudomonas palustris]|uniref:hypothetical protein n=1 Tax=Rhodopseudomonas palustris TaxID=1076 RepID=UPI0021F33B71|nr:hypothetical protein [Rhodopseudomonas palustris]UYO53119.1 hypothetical protein KQX61_21365 [Rhodopseudomonas palustris]